MWYMHVPSLPVFKETLWFRLLDSQCHGCRRRPEGDTSKRYQETQWHWAMQAAIPELYSHDTPYANPNYWTLLMEYHNSYTSLSMKELKKKKTMCLELEFWLFWFCYLGQIDSFLCSLRDRIKVNCSTSGFMSVDIPLLWKYNSQPQL